MRFKYIIFISAGTYLSSVIIFHSLFVISETEGPSMMPSFPDGEIISKYVSTGESLDRGDVVSFKVKNYEYHFLKRIIGVPGDFIEVRGGRVILNGVDLVKEKYVTNNAYTADTYIEKINNEIYYPIIIAPLLDTSNNIETPETFIPDNYYFVLGDNRLNSLDSRKIGLIHISQIEDKFIPRTSIIYFLRKLLFHDYEIKHLNKKSEPISQGYIPLQ